VCVCVFVCIHIYIQIYTYIYILYIYIYIYIYMLHTHTHTHTHTRSGYWTRDGWRDGYRYTNDCLWQVFAFAHKVSKCAVGAIMNERRNGRREGPMGGGLGFRV
jgi:hypothetical protein